MKKPSDSLRFGLLILAVAVISGLVSGMVAYHLGVEALKVVNQPDNNPTKKFANNQKPSENTQAFRPIPEKDIILKTEKTIREKEANAKKERQKSP